MSTLKSHVRALVVGGGAVGTGLPINLAKAGWENASARAGRADGGLDLARGGPVAAVQHVLLHHAHPQVLGGLLQGPLKRKTGLNPGFYGVGNLRMAQDAGPDGRIHAVFRTAETKTCGVYHELSSRRKRSRTGGRSSAPKT